MGLTTLRRLHPLPSLQQTAQSRQNLFLFLRSRLSQRIALSVFGSIVAIEAVILVPSVYRREQELLDHLATRSAASLMAVATDVMPQTQKPGGGDASSLPSSSAASALPSAEAMPVPSPEQILARIAALEQLPFIVGGTLYFKTGSQAGERVGSFGQVPSLSFDQLDQFEGQALNRRQGRYDHAWVSPLLEDYLVVICHDTSGIRQNIVAFIGRIFFLVLIISGVVTLTTMAILRPLLITPILTLRNDLLRAAPAALRNRGMVPTTFDSLNDSRDDELGEVIKAFEQMFDRISTAIIQRQRTEAKLRESESRFRSLVQQAAESIFVLDAEATIVDVNQFALQTLGYSRDELVGRQLFSVNPTVTPERYQEFWQKLRKEDSITLESIHRRRDGSTYPVEVQANPIQKDGVPHILSYVRDISDRKEAEAIQARLAEIGELTAMIVHEVRNPLATIYMALTGFQKLDLPRGGQLRLELALEEAERLKRLLNEILTYSKDLRLAGERVELNKLCQELFQSLREMPAAEGRKIHLTTASQTLAVSGDRDKLKQVFINLVTNACEAIDAGETVAWTLESAPEQQIKIQVQNGGEPIPPDVLPKLTKPFISTKDTGNGLGLAITKRIVEAHGGRLTITSNITEGTTVTVLLPLSS